MEEQQELIVPFNKDSMKIGLFVIPFLTLVLCLFFVMSFSLENILGYYLTFLIQGIFVLFIAFFLVAFINVLILMKDDRPVAILNQEGIWVKYYGFIPWQGIEEVAPYIHPKGPGIAVVGIKIKDISRISRQATVAGKLGIFWSKIFGYPPILLSNITIDNEQVITFARRYMENGQ